MNLIRIFKVNKNPEVTISVIFLFSFNWTFDHWMRGAEAGTD